MKVRPVIRLQLHSVFCINPREYEQVVHDVTARQIAGDVTTAERILARVLLDNEPRYHELKSRRDAVPHDAALRGSDGTVHRAFMSSWPSEYTTVCDELADDLVPQDTPVTCLNCIAEDDT